MGSISFISLCIFRNPKYQNRTIEHQSCVQRSPSNSFIIFFDLSRVLFRDIVFEGQTLDSFTIFEPHNTQLYVCGLSMNNSAIHLTDPHLMITKAASSLRNCLRRQNEQLVFQGGGGHMFYCSQQ